MCTIGDRVVRVSPVATRRADCNDHEIRMVLSKDTGRAWWVDMGRRKK